MNKLKRNFMVIGLMIAIPAIGIVAGSFILHGYEKKYEIAVVQAVKQSRGVDEGGNQQFIDSINLRKVCVQPGLNAAFISVCDEYQEINLLTYASIITLTLEGLVAIFIYIIGLISRKSRSILFYFFRPGLFMLQVFSTILVVINSAILLGSIYFAETFYLGRINFLLIGIAAIGCLVTVCDILMTSLTPLKAAEIKVFGKVLGKSDYPTIWNFIDGVSKQVGVELPDTVIAGMEVTFFATEAKVICLDGEFKGRTLFISLPFCRVISKAELAAIIGHELGHFVGEDTKWSKKFYPIYRRATATMGAVGYSNSGNALHQMALLPALIFMNIFIYSFSKTERAISRERELHADSIGAIVASNQEMATALVKVHRYQHIWGFTQEKMKEALSSGQHIVNTSIFFDQVCRSVPNEYMKNEIGVSHTPHPIDSHPSLLDRLSALGITLEDAYEKSVQINDYERAVALVDNAEVIEKELSDIENYRLVQSGQVTIPVQKAE